MNKRCPYHEGTRPIFTNTLFVKGGKLVMEVCDCGYVLKRQKIPIRLNPNSFIREGSDEGD